MGIFGWLFRSRKNIVFPRRSKDGIKSIGIRPTAKMIREADQDADEVSRLLRSRLDASGYFVLDRVPDLVSRLRRSHRPFQRASIDAVTDGADLLSANEKRALGLNTHRRYSRDFIGFFRTETLPDIDPKTLLSAMQQAVSFEVSRRRTLSQYRQSKVVKTVRIFPLGDPDSCAAVRKLKQRFTLNNAPSLPLPGCDAAVCRCSYDAAEIR
jgi:hypothetical protein